MTLETLILAAVLAAGLHVIRCHHQVIRGVWGQAKWWERLLLVVALAPVPGPLEELAGLLVMRRVIARGVQR